MFFRNNIIIMIILNALRAKCQDLLSFHLRARCHRLQRMFALFSRKKKTRLEEVLHI